MVNFVQKLDKTIANSEGVRKNWEVPLASLVAQCSSTPVQSEDIALFQRD
jgi:hypothetical protein